MPGVETTRPVLTRLPKATIKELDRFADKLQGNRSQAVRLLVVEGLDRHKHGLAQEG